MNSNAWSCALILTTLKMLPLVASTWATPVVEPKCGETQIAIHESGNIVVISENTCAQNHVIEATSYNHSENNWSLPISLSTLDLDVRKYRLAADPSGNAVAIWQVSDGIYDKIQASIYSQATDTWSPVKDLSDFEQNVSITHLAIDENRNVFASWKHSKKPYDLETSITYLSEQDKWVPSRARLALKEDEDKPDVMLDAKANALIVRNKKTCEAYVISMDQAPEAIISKIRNH